MMQYKCKNKSNFTIKKLRVGIVSEIKHTS